MRLQMSRPLGSQFDSRLAGAVEQIVSSRRSPRSRFSFPALPWSRPRETRACAHRALDCTAISLSVPHLRPVLTANSIKLAEVSWRSPHNARHNTRKH
jgi:hypothetical protein